jgi:hypothetical protein
MLLRGSYDNVTADTKGYRRKPVLSTLYVVENLEVAGVH